MDAIYMVTITIFGVGYGEVHPIETPQLRLMTILLIVFGYGSAIYTGGGLVQMLMEGEINRALNNRRMTKGIEELRDHAIVCGFGRAGSILVKNLQAAGKPFVVIDQDDEKLTAAEQMHCLVLQGNATEDDVLLSAGVQHASVLATVLPDDAANVFITLTARVLNPEVEIIARAEHPATEKKLLRSGATHVVSPAVIGGRRMAQLITHPSREELLADPEKNEQLQHELSQIGLQIHEVAVSNLLAGHPVGDITSTVDHKFLIVAVQRQEGEVEVDPALDCMLEAGDALVVLARGEQPPQLTVKPKSSSEILYRGAKIAVSL
ncbi:Inner membrane protein YbaL [Bythopirellula polymerisocia]|uniref:Inner membrane protein YbaL n=2 Tax=Bythopirellula polymerisocia TaxID=2528003 RepID=A0A5C6D212_9BACT|nr:Inner membrane protein YbaL [Bythopirellula polymerisocia]